MRDLCDNEPSRVIAEDGTDDLRQTLADRKQIG